MVIAKNLKEATTSIMALRSLNLVVVIIAVISQVKVDTKTTIVVHPVSSILVHLAISLVPKVMVLANAKEDKNN